MIKSSVCALAATILVAGLSPAPDTKAASAAPRPEPTLVAESLVPPGSARHSLRLKDKEIVYTARWAEAVLKDEMGTAQATISATSYVREGVGDRTTRPVIFLFNGGPGASSSPLHFDAFGPRLRSREGTGSTRIKDNPHSPIDVADLVFIDPVGTGFSRPLREGGGEPYWSVDGDARAALTLIREWLRENERSNAPVIVVGQSYGGLRLARMAKDMHELNVVGLVLISPVTDRSANAVTQGNDLPYIFSLPSMATTAWFHGRSGDPGVTASEVWEKARAFAQGEYASALQEGAALPERRRKRMAEKIARLIGLPTAVIESEKLRVDTQLFLETLLADENKIVGRLDTRVTAEKAAEPDRSGRPPAANDPALGLGESNVIKAPWAAEYFREELDVETGRDYYSLTLDVNFSWNWRPEETGPQAYFNLTPNIAALMEKKPRLRVLLASGYYDLATPMLAQRYALTHGGLPLDRVEMAAFEGGHSPYENEKDRAALSARLRDMAYRAAAQADAN
ncbi:S10 family peptidase [Amphiplicatus metriothermophilus]|uniref:Carboxypeptidase C (Cathepsin A) n=1 Tax=Amphiplicatus metriothermophilus TaxID=1519374 RepID=A0A239PVS6_9PROT|nr:hypothetical protein [Amphiplicatus metriothermophilus]MBB5519569.1 carboxypeptidase C (cathepsin A) [Amphiplicatus metriothermophilus]SNT74133.1 Carboxypeptidase C (cathepsin A) [Amphiplicatus metriothermophilus]